MVGMQALAFWWVKKIAIQLTKFQNTKHHLFVLMVKPAVGAPEHLYP
jgi:hypothetical protein